MSDVHQSESFEILLVEDDADIRDHLYEALIDEGYAVRSAQDGRVALKMLSEREYDLVISDIRMPNVDGMTLFHHLREEHSATPVILMTAFGTVPEAVSALRNRALHYLTKPFDLDELLGVVQQTAEQTRAARKVVTSGAASDAFYMQVGESPAMQQLRRSILAAAQTDAPVLIHGASGTGKELVAKAIHELGARREHAFVAVNCASLPEPLFESEVFGYERGAFTGANQRRDGRFRAAHLGTLFLDEIGELTLSLQPKLLRVLQEGTLQPLGSDTTSRVDVRVLSATNVDLRKAIADGKFRDDLYYRLRILDIYVPSLRERVSDLPVLVAQCMLKHGGDVRHEITPRAWAALCRYEFPGNIRELEHAVRRALVMAGEGPIDVEHLPDEIRDRLGPGSSAPEDPTTSATLAQAMASFEREFVLRALEQCGGSRTKTAELLGISRKSVWEKLKRYRTA